MQLCSKFELAYTCKEFQHFDVTQGNEYTFVSKRSGERKENQPLGGSFGASYVAFWC